MNRGPWIASGIAAFLAAVLLVGGCSSQTAAVDGPTKTSVAAKSAKDSTHPNEGAPDNAPSDADQLFDQIHSALYQLDSTVKDLGDAMDSAKDVQSKASGPLADYLKTDLLPTLDDVGANLQDLAGSDPPTKEQVTENIGKYQALHSDLVNRIAGSWNALREQEDAAADMADNGPAEIQASATNLDRRLSRVMEDLQGTLNALGYQVTPNANPSSTPAGKSNPGTQ